MQGYATTLGRKPQQHGPARPNKQKWAELAFLRTVVFHLTSSVAAIGVLAVIGQFTGTNFLTPAGFAGVAAFTAFRLTLAARKH